LLELKDRYNLNYRCHNYFPPPKQPFVLNLASLNDETFQMSFDHLKKVIALSNRLGADKFAFHAGFFIDIKLNEIGKKLSRDNLFSRDLTTFSLKGFKKPVWKSTNSKTELSFGGNKPICPPLLPIFF